MTDCLPPAIKKELAKMQVMKSALCKANVMEILMGLKNEISAETWNWCKDKKLWVVAKHIPCAQNNIAD